MADADEQQAGERRESGGHLPVMTAEVLQALAPVPGGVYVDATCGLLGHTAAIAERLAGSGRIIAIDRDPRIIALARERDEATGRDGVLIELVCDSYANLTQILEARGIGEIGGILWDCGVNSRHFDCAEFGFSFARDGPLRMAFDGEAAEVDAQRIVNRYPERELAELIHRFGEERKARQVARAIVAARNKQPIRGTLELAAIVRRVVPRSPRDRQDPCTRTFQALRIAVNDELGHLQAGLAAGLKSLRRGGTAVTLTYHSLEDRICKRAFAQAAGKLTEIHQPLYAPDEFEGVYQLLYKKPLTPAAAELRGNPRSRGAKLRAIRRV